MFQQCRPPAPIDPLARLPDRLERPQPPNTDRSLANGKNRSTDMTTAGGRTPAEGTELNIVSNRPHREQGTVNLDVDFPGLVATRESKALKLISPATNAPISPEREGILRPTPTASHPAKNAKLEYAGKPSKERDCDECGNSIVKALPHQTSLLVASMACHNLGECGGPMSPTSGLPIGSKLRRWMVSPGPRDSVSGSVDGEIGASSQATAEDGQSFVGVHQHSNILASEPADTVDPEIRPQRARGTQSTPCEEYERAEEHGVHPKGGCNASNMKGTGVATDGEDLTTRAEVGCVVVGGGYLTEQAMHSHASGIPRDSRLRVWMAGAEQ